MKNLNIVRKTGWIPDLLVVTIALCAVSFFPFILVFFFFLVSIMTRYNESNLGV